MQKLRLIFLAVGLLLGAVAAYWVWQNQQDIAETEKQKAEKAVQARLKNQVAVMVAKQDIPANTEITSIMVDSAIVPREYVQPQAATAADSVIGMFTVAPVSKGEQISMTKLYSAGEGKRAAKPRELSEITPAGKRAVSVSADNISDLIGLIKPGDQVDVTAILSIPVKGEKDKPTTQETIVPVFQGVLVLAVGGETSPSRQLEAMRKSTGKAPLVTLALFPKEANILAFVQEQGKIILSLRSAEDKDVEVTQPITWENISEYIPSLRGEKGGETIEIYRGLSKEAIQVSE